MVKEYEFNRRLVRGWMKEILSCFRNVNFCVLVLFDERDGEKGVVVFD